MPPANKRARIVANTSMAHNHFNSDDDSSEEEEEEGEEEEEVGENEDNNDDEDGGNDNDSDSDGDATTNGKRKSSSNGSSKSKSVANSRRKRQRRAVMNTNNNAKIKKKQKKAAERHASLDSAIISHHRPRPTRRLQEAVEARNEGRHPPMAAFHAQFDLVVAKSRHGMFINFQPVKNGDYQRVCYPTDSRAALQDHPLSKPLLNLKMEWEYSGKALRTLKGANRSNNVGGRYRRLCRGIDLKRRLSGIPPLSQCKPTVSYHYQFKRKKEGMQNKYETCTRAEVREDFCCPFCQMYCPDMASLVCHLTCSHDHFHFQCKGTTDQPEIWVKVLPKALEDDNRYYASGNYYYSKSLPRVVQLLYAHANHNANRHKVALLNEDDNGLKTTDLSSSDDRPTVRKKKKLNNGKSSGVDFLLQLSKPSNETKRNLHNQAIRNYNMKNSSQKLSMYTVEGSFSKSSSPNANNDNSNGNDTAIDVPTVDDDFKQYSETAHLHFRRYYHSKTSQPMEHPLIQEDSDDDVDEEWILEQGEKLLDEFEDVSIEEKQFMKMWNRFIFYNKIFADYQVASRCVDFANAHGLELLQKNLRENFMLHLINMWDFALITSDTIAKCMVIVDQSDLLPEDSDGTSNNVTSTGKDTINHTQVEDEEEVENKLNIDPAAAKRISRMRNRIGTVKSSILTLSDDIPQDDFEELKKTLDLSLDDDDDKD